MHYGPKRYKIAPWKGTYGDQAHSLRVHPHVDKIAAAIDAKKAEMRRLEQQIRQLEYLEKSASGVIIDGVLVSEYGSGTGNYTIGIVSRVTSEDRSARTYPNAHNKGATYGLNLYRGGYPFRESSWRGTGHSLEEAVEGARAWVLRSEIQPFRIKRKDGTVRVGSDESWF